MPFTAQALGVMGAGSGTGIPLHCTGVGKALIAELGESSFREDGRATARLVRAWFPGRLVILGESLGSGVAASVAADREVKADAVILATPWDSLTTVAAQHYPWLPVRLLLRDRYDSVAYLQSYPGHVVVLMAEDDEIMPAASTLAL